MLELDPLLAWEQPVTGTAGGKSPTTGGHAISYRVSLTEKVNASKTIIRKIIAQCTQGCHTDQTSAIAPGQLANAYKMETSICVTVEALPRWTNIILPLEHNKKSWQYQLVSGYGSNLR